MTVTVTKPPRDPEVAWAAAAPRAAPSEAGDVDAAAAEPPAPHAAERDVRCVRDDAPRRANDAVLVGAEGPLLAGARDDAQLTADARGDLDLLARDAHVRLEQHDAAHELAQQARDVGDRDQDRASTVMVIQTSGGTSGLPGTGRRTSPTSATARSAAARRQNRAAAVFLSWNGISHAPG